MMLGMNDGLQWWFNPGEEIWRSETTRRRVKFVSDDGELWLLHEPVVSDARFHWEHSDYFDLVSDTDFEDDKADLVSWLKRRSPPLRLRDEQRAVLNLVVSGCIGERARHPHRLLREQLRSSEKVLNRCLNALEPRYISRWSGPYGFEYQAELAGLLESDHQRETRDALTEFLRALHHQYTDDPLILKLERQHVDWPVEHDRFLDLVVGCARVGRRDGPAWTLPGDAPDLKKCLSAEQFLDYAQSGGVRGWPTAPARTATEMGGLASADPDRELKQVYFTSVPSSAPAPDAPTQRTAFYSWQSDSPAKTNRYLILAALEQAVKSVNPSLSVEVVVDRDTINVPGSPDITHTILQKIAECSLFVADVTIVGREPRPTPNPNVLVELGYAIRCLGWERVVLVMNTVHGDPEELPFDLRQKRVTTYRLARTEKPAEQRKHLAGLLQETMRLVFDGNPN